MPNQDAFAILAEARRMGLELASQESGAAENPNIAWKRLSLAEASVGSRDPDVAAALNTPQSPADPRWSMRLPQPPCEHCAMDHRGNKVYDHVYVHPADVQEAQRFIDAHPEQSRSNVAQPTPIREGVEREIVNRVAIYDSRTGYIVKVEAPPEWDDVPGSKVKMGEDDVRRMLPVLKALGVRVKNNSENEFEEESRADQSRSDSQAAPARVGDGPRRSPEEAEREWRELLPGTDAPSPEPASEYGDERPDSDGQEAGAARGARTRKAG